MQAQSEEIKELLKAEIETTTYKIYNPSSKMFSKGGFNLWSKQGKTWSSMGALKNHLRVVLEPYLRYHPSNTDSIQRWKQKGFVYKDCIVVVLESGKDLVTYPVKELLLQMNKIRNESVGVIQQLEELYGKDFV